MTQFHAYQNKNPESTEQYPYLVEIQSDFLSALQTTVVIPMATSSSTATVALSRLNPAITIHGESYTLMTQDIAGITRSQLGASIVDIQAYRSEIMGALDFLMSGI